MTFCGVEIKDGALLIEECNGLVGVLIGGVKKEVTCQVARGLEVVGSAIIEVGGKSCHVVSDVQCSGGHLVDLAQHVIDCSLDSINLSMVLIAGVLVALVLASTFIICRVRAINQKLRSRMGEKITMEWSKRGLRIRKRITETPVYVSYTWKQLILSIVMCRALFDYGLVQQTEACTQFSQNLINGMFVYSASFLDHMQVCVDGYKMTPIMPEMRIQAPISHLSCDYDLSSYPEEMCGDYCGSDCGQYEGGVHTCFDGNITADCPSRSKLQMGLLKEYRKYCDIHSRNFIACLGHSWGCWKWTSILSVDPKQCSEIRSLWSETEDFEVKVFNVSGVDLELMLSPYQKVIGSARDYLVTRASKSWLCGKDAENIRTIMVHKKEDKSNQDSYWWKFNWDTQSCHTKEKESDGLCMRAQDFNPGDNAGCHALPLKYGSYTLEMRDRALVAKSSGLWHVRILSKYPISFSKEPDTCTGVEWAIVGTRTGALPLYVTVKADSVDQLEMQAVVSCLGLPVSIKCDGHLHSFEVDSEACEVGGVPIKSFVIDEVEVESIREHIDGTVRKVNARLVKGTSLLAVLLVLLVAISVYRCCCMK